MSMFVGLVVTYGPCCQILGISPLDGFDHVKMAYKWRQKNAENNGDAAYLLKVVLGPCHSVFGACVGVSVSMSWSSFRFS